MCGRARRQLHRTALTIGIVLLAIVALLLALPVIFAQSAEGIIGGMVAVLFFTSILWIVGLVLSIVGVLGGFKTKRINREDWATATAIAAHADDLLRQPTASAHTSGSVIPSSPPR